jgi:hypothetical protein
MLVDRNAVEAELVRQLQLVEIAIVELVPLGRVEVGVWQHHPGGAVFVLVAHVQMRIGHQMKHEDFHRGAFPDFCANSE